MKSQLIRVLSITSLVVSLSMPSLVFANTGSAEKLNLEESFRALDNSNEFELISEEISEFNKMDYSVIFQEIANIKKEVEMSAKNKNIDEDISIELIDSKEFKVFNDTRNTGKNVDVIEKLEFNLTKSDLPIYKDSNMVKDMERNTDPNSALYIPEDYYGIFLGDIADTNDRWYAFESTGKNKISIIFEQDGGSGDYDIYLYRLDGSTLNLVDYSDNVGGSEKISYVADSGIYFLRINPYIPSTTSYYYNFLIDVLSNFDSYESNDFYYEASEFTDTISLKGTIDSPFDEDWYKLSVTESNGKYVNVKNVPDGEYAMFIYDSNLNSIGSYLINSNQLKTITLTRGDYYFRILSYYGNYTNQEYELSVSNRKLGLDYVYLNSGHIIEFDNDNLYINGVEATINGQYSYYSNSITYRRSNQSITYFDESLEVGDKAYSYQYYLEGSGWKTAEVVPVIINDGYYHGFVNTGTPNSYNSMYWDTDPDRPLKDVTIHVDSIMVFVDLNTGKVVDNEWSMHYHTIFYGLTPRPPVLIK